MNQNELELRAAATVEDQALHQTLGPEKGFELRSDQEGKSYFEAYVATKEGYEIRGEHFDEEFMTEDALKSIARQINEANEEMRTADVVFPDPSTKEKTMGNIEHQNRDKTENLFPMLADTRAVPAIEMREASYDGYGTKVRAYIREEALPDDVVEATKNNIKEGILSAMSMEFRNAKDRLKRSGGRIKRFIDDLDFAGAGMTHRPRNPTASITEVQLNSVISGRSSHMDEKMEQKASMIPMPEDVQLLYPSQGQAEAAAMNLGMDESSHTHQLDGKTWYMPGEDHESFIEHMTEMRERMRLKEETNEEEMRAEFEFETGDWVERDWQGGTVVGKIRDRTMDQFTVDGNTITGDEDEPVYKFEEYDEEEEEFTGQMIAVPQSSVRNWSGAPETRSTRADMDLTPPQTAQDSAQQALDWREEHPEEIEGMTEVGWNRAEQLAEGEELSPADIADGTDGMANWWARHGENFRLEEEFEGEPWKDAGYVAGLGWGGEVGKNWSMRMKDRIEEMREQRSKHTEQRRERESVAGVSFIGTKDGELDESEIPNDDFEPHYLFDEETKSESSYPVVDGEGYLRRGNLEAAKSLGARGGVDADELDRKLKALNNQFDTPPLTFKEERSQVSDVTMAEEPTNGDEPESGGDEPEENGEPDQGDSQETESLRSTVTELKSTVDEIKSENEELREENEELRSDLEDYKEFEEMRNELGDLKEELRSISTGDEPVTDPNEEKFEDENENEGPAELRAASAKHIKKNTDELAEKYEMSEDEVLDYV